MGTAASLGLAGLALVFSVSLIGGASLPGSALRAAGAFVLFGVLGLFLHLLWQSLTAQAAHPASRQPAGPRQAAALPANRDTAAGPAPGALLDQVLPAASPADLFEPLAPPVLTAKRTEE
ncbi:MAG: hypothetical protein ACYC5Y_09675 [Symbiobacteriia bacterium]